MTDLAKIPKRNGVTPLLSKSLDLPDLERHRAMVAVELEVLAKKFDRFGWERDRGSHAHDRLVTDWMNALQDYPLPEVQAACAKAIIENPNKMPNEGHVRAAILANRAKAVAAQPKPIEPPSPQSASAEERARADEILAAAGFATRRANQDKEPRA